MTGLTEVFTAPLDGSTELCTEPGCRVVAAYVLYTAEVARKVTCTVHHLGVVDRLLHPTNAPGSKRVVDKAVAETVGPWSARDVGDQLLAAAKPEDLPLIAEQLAVALVEDNPNAYIPTLSIRIAAAAERLTRAGNPDDAATLRQALTALTQPWRDDHINEDPVRDLQAITDSARAALEIIIEHPEPN